MKSNRMTVPPSGCRTKQGGNMLRNLNEIKHSPEYHPDQPVNLAYEFRLYDYYGRPAA
jgi:hypothetical protein